MVEVIHQVTAYHVVNQPCLCHKDPLYSPVYGLSETQATCTLLTLCSQSCEQTSSFFSHLVGNE